MTDPFVHRWKQKFKESEMLLKNQYPALADAINQHLWYGDVLFGVGIVGMEDVPLVINPQFWDPPQPMKNLILENVTRHLGDWQADPKGRPLRLRQKKNYENYAPLSEVPTPYSEQFERYMNDRTLRLSHFDEKAVHVQQACYLDQLGSNILCDQKNSNVTARQLDQSGQDGLPSLGESALANTIGVACIFVGSDNVPVLRFRQQEATGERMAIMQKGWHCTSSGVLKFDDVIDAKAPDAEYTLRDFRKGLFREANYEAGIWDHENLYQCELVGFGRELKRAGKPQFFYRIQFNTLTAKDISTLIRKRHKKEADEYMALQHQGGALGTLLSKLLTPGSDEMRDMMVDPRLCLDQLTRSDLIEMAETPRDRMTFECFANLWMMVEH